MNIDIIRQGNMPASVTVTLPNNQEKAFLFAPDVSDVRINHLVPMLIHREMFGDTSKKRGRR